MRKAADQLRPDARTRDKPAADVQRERRRRRWRRFKWAVRIGALLLIVSVFLVGFDRLFYFPTRTVHYTPDEFSLSYEDATFSAADGVRLSGWFLPATGRAKGTVIHFHGNAENITAHFPLSCWLVWEGYNVLVFDYRCYGKSAGRVTRKGTILDGHAAVDYVLSRDDIDPQRIVAFGQSLGGAVATVVAAEREEVRAIVLDSTFSSYRRIGSMHLQKMLFFRWLTDAIAWLGLSGDYDPVDCISRIAPRPVLVIASAEDEICFAESARELFEAAADPREFVLVQTSAHLETVAENIDNVQQKILRLFERALDESPE
jgi:fermentation-respiration switch protein FrsA (DUF1100 family)